LQLFNFHLLLGPGIFRRQQAPLEKTLSVGWSVGRSVGRMDGRSVGRLVSPMVRPHITLSTFFSAVCGRIDLKFGRDFHVDLLF
jgi:hypothetical protein